MRKTRVILSILFLIMASLYAYTSNGWHLAFSSLADLIKRGGIASLVQLLASSDARNWMLSLAFILFIAATILSLFTLTGIVGGLLLSVVALLTLKVYDARLATAAIMTGAFTTTLIFDLAHVAYDLSSRRRLTQLRRLAEKPAEPRGYRVLDDSRDTFPLGPLKIASRIDKFNIIDYVGKGTHSAVYRVVNTKSGGHYAMKIPLNRDGVQVLLKEVEVSDLVHNYNIKRETIEAFFKPCPNIYGYMDADAIARKLEVHKDNIIKVLKHNVKGNAYNEHYINTAYSYKPFYIVEELANSDLTFLLENYRDKRVFIKFLLETSGALAVFHATTKKVHRDVKPSNFLVIGDPSKTFKIVLTDFATAAEAGTLNKGWSPGTPYYMAPEGLLYTNYKLTYSYDVYGLSVLFYRFITNSIPLQQYYLIAVSRHPLISFEYKEEALRVINTFELGALGTTGALLSRFREIAYPSQVTFQGDADSLLDSLDSFLEENHSGRAVVEETQSSLEAALRKLDLPLELSDIIMDGLRLSPKSRIANAVCMWLNIAKLLEE